MQCITCYRSLPPGAAICPRCGCPHYVFGNSQDDLTFMNRLSTQHRASILLELNFGITVYKWRDLDGNVFLDKQLRRSFGDGIHLLNNRTWLPDQFARIPGEKEMVLNLSIHKCDAPHCTIPVTIPAPQEPELVQVGIELYDNLTASLFLRNKHSLTHSFPVDFMTL